jgi:aminoglycoside phosphotransferase (APT) family kinase protein
MAILQKRDPETASRALVAWLASKLDGASDIRIEVAGASEASGFSSDTIIFDALYRDGSGTEQREGFVARAAPFGEAVFEEYEIGLQYRVVKALGEHSTVRVPKTRWLEEDPAVLGAPFMVMERLQGRVPGDNPPYTLPAEWLPPDSGFDAWVLAATPEQQRRMWFEGIDQLAAIAQVDWRALGLDELDRKEYGQLGHEQLSGYQHHYYEWATRKPVPCLDHAWQWLDANRPDDDHLVGLSWGDSRLGNLMFDDDFRVVGVLDWEMVRVANPELDLAWYMWFDKHFTDVIGLPKVPGFPSDEESIAHWEAKVGRKAEHIEYYTVLTMAFFAAIMMRVAISNMAHGGNVEELAPLETNNTATQALANHFGLAPPE